ncbi:hypothetical protein BGX27_009780 [Mortierella sp. AM989]|nr:hypothetical protein BGX27_009780 [Mortierella sp. AM989]
MDSPILSFPVELWSMVGLYLDPSSIASCILVCRNFHYSFTPLLWRNIDCHRSQIFDAITLRKHKRSIEILTISQFLPKEYGYIIYRRLNLLSLVDICKHVNDTTSGACIDLAVSLAVLANINTHIKHLEASFVDNELSNRFWYAIATKWVNPISLSVKCSKPLEEKSQLSENRKHKNKRKYTSIDSDINDDDYSFNHKNDGDGNDEQDLENEVYGDEMSYFWEACSRFKNLSLAMPTIPYEGMVGNCSMERIERLTLSKLWQAYHPTTDVSTRHSVHELNLMDACPNLRYLSWDLNMSKFPTERFTSSLRLRTWPLLTALVLRNVCVLLDSKIADILSLVPNPLQEFELQDSLFGAEAFWILSSRHFQTLERLSTKGCNGFTSEMVRQVLTGCSRLKYFGADYMTMKDASREDDVWVCRGLQHFFIFFAYQQDQDQEEEEEEAQGQEKVQQTQLDQDEMNNRRVLGKIAGLSELKSLVLSMDMYALPSYPKGMQESARMGRSLKLRLDDGLEQLEGLICLEHLGFDRTIQEMSLQDVEWMMRHWRKLQTVSGGMNRDGVQHSRLVDALDERRVVCSPRMFGYYQIYSEVVDSALDCEDGL